MGRRAWAAIAVLGLALAAAACGDDDGGAAGAAEQSGTAAAPLDDAAYEAAANAACADGKAGFDAALAGIVPASSAAGLADDITTEQQQGVLDAFVVAVTSTLDELEALTPPADRVASLEAFVAAGRAVAAEAAAADPAEFAIVGADDAAIEAAVQSTGLQACIEWVVGT